MRLNPKATKITIQVTDPTYTAKASIFDASISEVIDLLNAAIKSECGAEPKWNTRNRKQRTVQEAAA